MANNTRNLVNCPILGPPAEMPTNVLPTTKSVILHLLFTAKKNKKKIPDTAVVAKCLENIWIKASIPTVTRPRIIQLLNETFTSRKALLKIPIGRY